MSAGGALKTLTPQRIMLPFTVTTSTPVFCFIIGGDMHENPHWSGEWQCPGYALMQFTLNETELALFLPNEATDPETETEITPIYYLAFPGRVPFSRQTQAPRTKPTS